MNIAKNKQNAFTLIELLIVLAISMVMISLGFQAKERDALYDRAAASGHQISTLQKSFNDWIKEHAEKLSAQPAWDIPVSYLVNGQDPNGVSGFMMHLPSGFTNANPWGSDYVLHINRLGTAPNYSLQGLVVTRTPWVINGKIRLDLVGRAVLAAGGDSGMTNSAAEGTLLGGATTFLSADFPAITTPGQLIAQSGTVMGVPATFWKDPVATYVDLPVLSNTSGDSRVVKDIARAFTWDGATWRPFSVDQNGNLSMAGKITAGAASVAGTVESGKVQLNDVVVKNTVCGVNGTVAADSDGVVLSCQSGLWRNTESAWNQAAANCTANGYVYTGGSCQKIATFPSSNYALGSVVSTFSYRDMWFQYSGFCLYSPGTPSSAACPYNTSALLLSSVDLWPSSP